MDGATLSDEASKSDQLCTFSLGAGPDLFAAVVTVAGGACATIEFRILVRDALSVIRR